LVDTRALAALRNFSTPTYAGAGLRLAPWVVTSTQGAQSYLLGPALALLRVDCAEVSTSGLVDAVARSVGTTQAIGSGFLVAAAASSNSLVTSGHCTDRRLDCGAGPPITGLVVCGAGVPAAEGRELGRLLSDRGGRWEAASGAAALAEWCISAHLPAVVLIAHGQQEQDKFARTLPTGCVLRVCESFEGAFVTRAGGITAGADEPASAGIYWAFEARVNALGFTDRPSTTRWRLRSDPDGLAAAILAVVRARSDEAVLVTSRRTVSLGTPHAVRTTRFADVKAVHSWTFGVMRGLTVERGAIPGSYVAVCRTPAGGRDELEGNSGKGVDPESAITGAVGEALERYAAYEANTSLKPAARTIRRIHLADLHPFGVSWARHRSDPPDSMAYVEGVDLVDDSAVAVPKALVVFPYLGTGRPTDSTTTGLAAGGDQDTAVVRGLREVLERSSLYRSFSQMLPALRLDPADALRSLGLESSFPGDIWCLHWTRDSLTLPDVHAFYHDPATGLLVRASGSGVTFHDALRGAVLELCQVFHEAVRARRACTPTSPVHARWTRTDVVDEARFYLDAQPARPCPDVPYADERGQREHLVGRLGACGRNPVAVRLPLRGPDWTVVRVLVPLATTSPHASDSPAGAALTDQRWAHGIPT